MMWPGGFHHHKMSLACIPVRTAGRALDLGRIALRGINALQVRGEVSWSP